MCTSKRGSHCLERSGTEIDWRIPTEKVILFRKRQTPSSIGRCGMAVWLSWRFIQRVSIKKSPGRSMQPGDFFAFYFTLQLFSNAFFFIRSSYKSRRRSRRLRTLPWYEVHSANQVNIWNQESFPYSEKPHVSVGGKQSHQGVKTPDCHWDVQNMHTGKVTTPRQ